MTIGFWGILLKFSLILKVIFKGFLIKYSTTLLAHDLYKIKKATN
jgi:hypothetical protein